MQVGVDGNLGDDVRVKALSLVSSVAVTKKSVCGSACQQVYSPGGGRGWDVLVGLISLYTELLKHRSCFLAVTGVLERCIVDGLMVFGIMTDSP